MEQPIVTINGLIANTSEDVSNSARQSAAASMVHAADLMMRCATGLRMSLTTDECRFSGGSYATTGLAKV